MAKIITFSRTFPIYHSKKGQLTFFVEKIGASFMDMKLSKDEWMLVNDQWDKLDLSLLKTFEWTKFLNNKKSHTIRLGNRFKVGDKFSPRFWSGLPYRTKMITIAPDIIIKKVWSFDIREGLFFIDKKRVKDESILYEVAKNDGLNRAELFEWFKYPKNFSGQIICWNDKINY